MKRDWVIAVVGGQSPPFAASRAIAEAEAKREAVILGGNPSDPNDVAAAKQIRSIVQRVLGEDDPSPSPKDAAPRPVSAEDADEEAKAEEQAKAKKPAPLPPV